LYSAKRGYSVVRAPRGLLRCWSLAETGRLFLCFFLPQVLLSFLVSMSFFFRFDLQKFKFCAFQKILRNSPLPGASPRLPLLTVTLPICTLSMACQWLDASRAARWSLRAGSGLHNFKKGADKHAIQKCSLLLVLKTRASPPPPPTKVSDQTLVTKPSLKRRSVFYALLLGKRIVLCPGLGRAALWVRG
jgi:hypothetical protein